MHQRPREQSPSVSFSLSASRTDIYPAMLPAAEEMERYEAMAPGSVDRVIRQFEKQSDHRRSMESRDLNSDIRLSNLGLYLAFGIVVAFLVAGTILVLNGFPVEGIGSGLTGLGVIVASFIYATKSRRAEREQKYKIMSGDSSQR